VNSSAFTAAGGRAERIDSGRTEKSARVRTSLGVQSPKRHEVAWPGPIDDRLVVVMHAASHELQYQQGALVDMLLLSYGDVFHSARYSTFSYVVAGMRGQPPVMSDHEPCYENVGSEPCLHVGFQLRDVCGVGHPQLRHPGGMRDATQADFDRNC